MFNFNVTKSDKDLDDDWCLTISENNTELGYIIYNPCTTADNELDIEYDGEIVYDKMSEFDTFVYIKEIHVYNKYRNNGIGNSLLSFFLDAIKNEPCLLLKSAIHINSSEKKYFNDIVLPKFYAKFGFKLIDSKQNYYLRHG